MTAATVTAVGTVEGMRCQHCVSSVIEEVEAIAGVRKARLDLRTARLALLADRPLEPAELRRAVTEAGYGLVLDA